VDVNYLLELLSRYFPSLGLSREDIVSAYIGVRPLAGRVGEAGIAGGALQKVSREHHIAEGPGGTVFVAGGKYTTHRKMAEEIVDFALTSWRQAAKAGKVVPPPAGLRSASTEAAMNPATLPEAVGRAVQQAHQQGEKIPPQIWERYGAGALELLSLRQESLAGDSGEDPAGFPWLEAQLRYAIRNEMVMHLDDFYLRRTPLALSRADQGKPWSERLARVWAQEKLESRSHEQMPLLSQEELSLLWTVLNRRAEWMKTLTAENRSTV
jgi:glycerol-3-phosphate dehydrogenase